MVSPWLFVVKFMIFTSALVEVLKKYLVVSGGFNDGKHIFNFCKVKMTLAGTLHFCNDRLNWSDTLSRYSTKTSFSSSFSSFSCTDIGSFAFTIFSSVFLIMGSKNVGGYWLLCNNVSSFLHWLVKIIPGHPFL